MTTFMQRLYRQIERNRRALEAADARVSIEAVLGATEKFLRAILLGAAALALIVFLLLSITRLSYPYELEWMEGAMVDTVQRIHAGEPLYAPPKIDYVPPLYGPVYFYVAAALATVTGVGFFTLRLVSLLAALATFALLAHWAKMVSGAWFAGLLAAGLFAAAYDRLGGWLDLARVDTLYLLLILLSGYLIYRAKHPRDYALAGIAIAAAVLTKISAAVIVPFLCLIALVQRPRWILAFIVGGIGLGLLGTLPFLFSSDGWFLYFLLDMGQRGGMGEDRLQFWLRDLSPLGIASLLGLMYVYDRFAQRDSRGFRFFALYAFGLLISAWLSRVHSGSWVNVLFPAYAVIALLFGLGLQGALQTLRALPAALRSSLICAVLLLGVVQFAGLAYDPWAHLPTEADRAAGAAFVERLAAVEGEVLLFAHGHYATLAGKPQAALGWLMNLVYGEPTAEKEAFFEHVRAAIASGRFSVIVTDNAFFLHEPFQEVLATYYESTPIRFEGAAFVPVTGAPVRPLVWHVRRSRLNKTREAVRPPRRGSRRYLGYSPR